MAEEQKVEKHEESSEGEEHDHANCKDHDHDHGDDHDLDPKSNRGEKKFKKAMSKMGLKPVTGINRVTIKKGKAFVISIDDPDVWKTPGNENSYIVFGKPNMDGLQSGQNEVNQFQQPVSVEEPSKPESQAEAAKEAPAEEISAEGISEDNIKMVMEYSQCSKAEAIKVLRETGDDSVNAIMKLSTK